MSLTTSKLLTERFRQYSLLVLHHVVTTLSLFEDVTCIGLTMQYHYAKLFPTPLQPGPTVSIHLETTGDEAAFRACWEAIQARVETSTREMTPVELTIAHRVSMTATHYLED